MFLARLDIIVYFKGVRASALHSSLFSLVLSTFKVKVYNSGFVWQKGEKSARFM